MKELRIGLVLYGGVSLAVYMNGVVTELWHALRASQSRAGGGQTDLDGTASVYKDLLDRLAEDANTEELRIVVDAVAGTSAGGVNGAALAKAVVEGGDARVLNTVWIEQADIAALAAEPTNRAPRALRWAAAIATTVIPVLRRLRKRIDDVPGIDWSWARDHGYGFLTSKSGTGTPLDGRYFTRMIAKTFKDMVANGPLPVLLPRRGTFDLSLTRTDLHGWPRHLPVSTAFHPEPLYERHHGHAMHFRRHAGHDRFDDDFGLTYASRSTAGFPVAFAPIGYADIAADFAEARSGDQAPPLTDFARHHLPEHDLANFAPEHAWMIDGGVLDNKPFSYVASAIERKPADHEVFRTVVYIEPDPETQIDKSPTVVPPPTALLGGLFTLARHEPIYDDLRRLDERNDKVGWILKILEAGKANAAAMAERAGDAASPPLSWPPAPTDLESWRIQSVTYAAGEALAGYPGYVVLLARRAADILCDLVCQALDFPYHTRHGYFVRRLVRAWLETHDAFAPPRFDPNDGHQYSAMQWRLFRAFDHPFRLRRLRTLVHAANDAYDMPDGGPERRSMLDIFKTRLADLAFDLEAPLDGGLGAASRIREALGGLDAAGINRAIEEVAFDPSRAIERYADDLQAVFDTLAEALETRAERHNQGLIEAIATLQGTAYQAVAKAYVTFPFIDVTLGPLMDTARLEDLVKVRTMRISPGDATSLSDDPQRLKGRELGAFAGFLRRTAREHDLLWGRLDGAERLVDLIVEAAAASGADPSKLATIREDFRRRAMKTILDQEAARPGSSLSETAAELRQKLHAP